MTTIDTKSGRESEAVKPDPQADVTSVESAPDTSVVESTDSSALITEQQVLFSSTAALAPAPSRRWSLVAAARAIFVRPEKPERPRARTHYPPRYGYIENAAMSREMDRL